MASLGGGVLKRQAMNCNTNVNCIICIIDGILLGDIPTNYLED